MLRAIKGRKVGDFNNHLHQWTEISKQKVSKEMKAVKDTLDQTDLINIFIINWNNYLTVLCS